jgi:hypothetical protein
MKNMYLAIIILSGLVENLLIAMNNNKGQVSNQEESWRDQIDKKNREIQDQQEKQTLEKRKKRDQEFKNMHAIDKMSDDEMREYNQHFMAKITLCKASCTDAPHDLNNTLFNLKSINQLLNAKKYGRITENEKDRLHHLQTTVKQDEPNIQVIITTQLQKESLQREAAQVKQQADREELQLQREKDQYKNEQQALKLERRQQELAIKEREAALLLAERQSKSQVPLTAISQTDNQTIYTATVDVISHEQNHSANNGCHCTIS